MAIRKLLAIFLLTGAALATSVPDAARADQPTSPAAAQKFIDDIGTHAIKVLGDAKTPLAQRQAEVRDLLHEGLDLDKIGRFALGRWWNTASETQRAQYLKLFDAYVVNTYSRRLSAYSGESFKVLNAQPIAGTDAVVNTQILRPGNEPLNTAWRVRDEDGHMKIIDVIVEGVSMVLTQRQEFASVLQNKGFDALLASLRAQDDEAKAAAAPDAK
ncbi:MAG TPA: ABC transporter substrate-binding protein [Alphaproteobacteria bacterium]|nr:ABC transporter substrate-binding protein [Alphaproteobacteria bacterium]